MRAETRKTYRAILSEPKLVRPEGEQDERPRDLVDLLEEGERVGSKRPLMEDEDDDEGEGKRKRSKIG